jgi:chromodomain-helicase-DNA-binding protein 7
VNTDAPAVAAPAGPQIDKILGVRKSKEKGRMGEDEFLVKWKDMSYMHVEWLDKDSTLQIGGAIRMKTFWKKKEEKDMMADLYEGAAEADEEYFDDGYLEIERIIAEREITAEDGVSPPQKQVAIFFEYFVHPRHQSSSLLCDLQFFIKWRAGDHDECSWEDVDDIKDDAALEQYNRFKKVPDPNLWLPTGSKRPANRIAYTSADSFKNGNTLREYQIEGANWIAYQWHHHTNCVLADEMGLGKTVQSVSSSSCLLFFDPLLTPLQGNIPSLSTDKTASPWPFHCHSSA